MIAEEGIDPVDREQLRIYFEQGCKQSSDWGIGSEYENFIIDSDLNRPVGYEGPKSISKVFDLLIKKFGWAPVFEKSNIVEAVEQCGGTFIPEILPISSLAEVIEELPEDRILIFCDESLESRNINECLLLDRPEKVAILVGPEGGFSDSERKLLRTKKKYTCSIFR